MSSNIVLVECSRPHLFMYYLMAIEYIRCFASMIKSWTLEEYLEERLSQDLLLIILVCRDFSPQGVFLNPSFILFKLEPYIYCLILSFVSLLADNIFLVAYFQLCGGDGKNVLKAYQVHVEFYRWKLNVFLSKIL